ncbi:DUF2835 domain-containing protein [Photobacterium damselae]|nr:DUF2835 domain-containing protein [Photobacterium damselae]
MRFFTFSLNIPYQVFLQHYSGSASQLMVYTDCGLKVQFPAIRFRSFVTQAGLVGRFKVFVTADNRFDRIERLTN